MPEPYVLKGTSTVLRGERGSNTPDLPDKRIYKEWRGLRYSDCYELWGFRRTGCSGCPCSSKAVEELLIAEKYEPNKVKAAFAVFGKSYDYREKYNRFKNPKISEGE